MLEIAEAGFGLVGGGGDAAAEDVELDFDAEESLENAVVEVAGDAAPFAFDGAGAQMAEEEDVFERGADVAGDAFQPGKVGALERLVAVDEKQAARGLAELIEGYASMERMWSSCWVGPGRRGSVARRRPSRRSQPKPLPAPSRLFQQRVASISSRRKPSARARE